MGTSQSHRPNKSNPQVRFPNPLIPREGCKRSNVTCQNASGHKNPLFCKPKNPNSKTKSAPTYNTTALEDPPSRTPKNRLIGTSTSTPHRRTSRYHKHLTSAQTQSNQVDVVNKQTSPLHLFTSSRIQPRKLATECLDPADSTRPLNTSQGFEYGQKLHPTTTHPNDNTLPKQPIKVKHSGGQKPKQEPRTHFNGITEHSTARSI